MLFARRVFDDLRRADPGVGAKAVVRAFAAEICNVPVDDEGACRDIDTPEDYARLAGPRPAGGSRDWAACRRLRYRLDFRNLKNSPSVDRMSVVSEAMVFRYVSMVFRNW